MSAAKIDVLTAMDNTRSLALDHMTCREHDDALEARAAVAELIEAALAMASPSATDVELFNAQPRLRAAIAKATGA